MEKRLPAIFGLGGSARAKREQLSPEKREWSGKGISEEGTAGKWGTGSDLSFVLRIFYSIQG